MSLWGANYFDGRHIAGGQIVLWGIFIFCLGLCVGSFMNVCIWRIPRRESVVVPPSHCPQCGHLIAWFENIPLLSWLCLRGHCSKCGCRISSRYFVVELLVGLLFLGIWHRTLSLSLPFSVFLGVIISFMAASMLAVLAGFIDFEHMIIPNKITYPALLYGIASSVIFPGLWPGGHMSRWHALVACCASITVCGGAMCLMAYVGRVVFKREALGWGDVKYIAALAALLGPVACFFTLFVASVAGATSGIALVACGKKRLRSPLPFGVCLAAGTMLWIFIGRESVAGYLRISQIMREMLLK
ncbi:MAG: prepilin peptidase [Victivallales bacterium]|nr:prepilin peptidase [Victivallales bacterium]